MHHNERPASPFKTIASRVVWRSPWYEVRQDDILLPDGSPGVYNVVHHPGAVWIIPVTRDGEIVLLYHYRYTVDDWCWEIPAGGVKPGLSLEDVARQELSEEIGGTTDSINYFGNFYTANGICDEVAHIFFAEGVVLGDTDHEAAEVIEVHPTPVAEALRMARANEISDGPTALALLLCEQALLSIVASD